MVTEAEALTRKIVEIFDVGAFDLIPSLIAPEYVDHQGLDDKEIRGPDGFRAVVEAVRRYQRVHVTVEELVADEERAAVRLRWYGVDQAGVVVTRETLDMLRFANGRLVEHWGSQLGAAQRGAVPPDLLAPRRADHRTGADSPW
jgi:predicted SnoaL-like aldol condensation-catalyzing enzyme